jgi:uncharacterized protein YbaR (Trm112 family)
MPALSCPSCKKTFQVPDPSPGAAMPAYSCPQCKTPLNPAKGTLAVPEAMASHEPVKGGGWVVVLLLALLMNVGFLVGFFGEASAVKQAALASLQTACTLFLFVVAYCFGRMGKKD